MKERIAVSEGGADKAKNCGLVRASALWYKELKSRLAKTSGGSSVGEREPGSQRVNFYGAERWAVAWRGRGGGMLLLCWREMREVQSLGINESHQGRKILEETDLAYRSKNGGRQEGLDNCGPSC